MRIFARPLIALSLGDSDRRLLRYAARVVGLGGCDEVRFAHVVDHRGPSEEEIESLRARIAAEVRECFALDVPVSFDVVHGVRLVELLALAVRYEHDVLLVGHRRERGGRRALARRLAMIAPCSVWVVPEGATESFDEPLVPVDFSQPSADALHVAVSIVAALGSKRCAALHVFFDPSTVRYEERSEDRRRSEQEALRRFFAQVDRKGVEVVPILEESAQPARAILRVVEQRKCGLIVMATRGRSRVAALLLGSVTSDTIAATTVPLLAVKHFGSQMTVIEALLDHRFWGKGHVKTN